MPKTLDRVDRQLVWDGTEILRVLRAAVMDFAPKREHRILVLNGAGTLRLPDGPMELSRGLTLVWTPSARPAVEPSSVQPLILLHQVGPPPSRPVREAPVQDGSAVPTRNADPSPRASPSAPARLTASGRAPLPTGPMAHPPSVPHRRPPGRADPHTDPLKWVLPPVVAEGGVHTSRRADPGPGADADVTDVPR